MTKPMNFPGRKQERRIRALARMEKFLEGATIHNAKYSWSGYKFTDQSILNMLKDIENTKRNIASSVIGKTKKPCPPGRRNRRAIRSVVK